MKPLTQRQHTPVNENENIFGTSLFLWIPTFFTKPMIDKFLLFHEIKMQTYSNHLEISYKYIFCTN